MAAVQTRILTVVIMTLSWVIMTSMGCPVRECSCDMGTDGVTIDCSEKNFDKVPEFETSTENFHELKLSGNQIAVIPGKAFKKLRVEKIDISGNPIRKISPLAFEGLETSLKELNIEAKTDTPIKFPQTLLHNLAALENVKIKGFDMPVLEHGLFLHSRNLQYLTLENCKIITIFQTAFQGLEANLKELDLSNNQLTVVPIQELKSLTSLKKLVLAQNRITAIQDESFQNMTHLIDLNLSQNSIQKLEAAAFAGLEMTLEYLGLHANMISQTSLLAIANLHKLEQLNLAYNLFHNTLPDHTFKHLNKLAYLNLQGNRLTAISPATFEGLGETLNVLILSENKLTTLPDEGFRHLEHLKWLYLDLMNLGGSFSQHTFHGLENTLEYLTLEGVQFMNDDLKSIHYLKELKSLNLCQNHVTKVPDGTFNSLNKLEQLMLCHNNIENITHTCLHGMEMSLQVLDLEGNAIENMNKCTFQEFKKIKQLNLDGNPLNCDCNLKWLRQWIEDKDDVTKMMIGWQCARPIQNKDRLVKHVSLHDFVCANDQQEVNCTDLVKATASPAAPKARISATAVTDESVSLSWSIQNPVTVVGVRLFYRMTENETYSITLLLNPMLQEYTIHDLRAQTNYTFCIGLDLKLGQYLPDEECITVTTVEAGYTEVHNGGNTLNMYVMLGIGIGSVVMLVILVTVIYQVYKWRRRSRRSKQGLYDTPWVTSRPQAPSLSTLPSRRSDFENPIRHYYSRPLSCGTIRTVSSNIPRSNSMATVLDVEYGRYRLTDDEQAARAYAASAYKRAQSMDMAHVYDMDRCLYKIDKMMASASNLLEHQRPVARTPIPPPYEGESLYSKGVRDGYHPDLPAYPAQVSDYHHYTRESYPPRGKSCDGDGDNPGFSPQAVYLTDTSLKTSLRDSGHLSGFPSYTSGFDELEPPPMEHRPPAPRESRELSRGQDHVRELRDQAVRSQQDPLPPPPSYLLQEDNPQSPVPDERIYDEIYTIY